MSQQGKNRVCVCVTVGILPVPLVSVRFNFVMSLCFVHCKTPTPEHPGSIFLSWCQAQRFSYAFSPLRVCGLPQVLPKLFLVRLIPEGLLISFMSFLFIYFFFFTQRHSFQECKRGLIISFMFLFSFIYLFYFIYLFIYFLFF